MLVSTVTGSKHFLTPGVEVVLGVVRMAVNERYPTLIPTLFPGSMATDPRPYALLGAMWEVFADLAHNKTPTISGETYLYQLVSPTDTWSFAPSGRRTAGYGRG